MDIDGPEIQYIIHLTFSFSSPKEFFDLIGLKPGHLHFLSLCGRRNPDFLLIMTVLLQVMNFWVRLILNISGQKPSSFRQGT